MAPVASTLLLVYLSFLRTFIGRLLVDIQLSVSIQVAERKQNDQTAYLILLAAMLLVNNRPSLAFDSKPLALASTSPASALASVACLHRCYRPLFTIDLDS